MIEPSLHKGDRPARFGNHRCRGEVGTVAGFGNRQRRAFGFNGDHLQMGGAERAVAAEPLFLVADFNGDIAPYNGVGIKGAS